MEWSGARWQNSAVRCLGSVQPGKMEDVRCAAAGSCHWFGAPSQFVECSAQPIVIKLTAGATTWDNRRTKFLVKIQWGRRCVRTWETRRNKCRGTVSLAERTKVGNNPYHLQKEMLTFLDLVILGDLNNFSCKRELSPTHILQHVFLSILITIFIFADEFASHKSIQCERGNLWCCFFFPPSLQRWNIFGRISCYSGFSWNF